MRWLVLAGSVVFAYLALVPGGLVISIVDPACAGSACEQPLAAEIMLGVLYGSCFAAFVACSVAMVVYFFRTTVGGEQLIRLALIAALATAGTTLFVQFALESPIAALATLALGGAVYATLKLRYGPESERALPDVSQNGHAS